MAFNFKDEEHFMCPWKWGLGQNRAPSPSFQPQLKS